MIWIRHIRIPTLFLFPLREFRSSRSGWTAPLKCSISIPIAGIRDRHTIYSEGNNSNFYSHCGNSSPVNTTPCLLSFCRFLFPLREFLLGVAVVLGIAEPWYFYSHCGNSQFLHLNPNPWSIKTIFLFPLREFASRRSCYMRSLYTFLFPLREFKMITESMDRFIRRTNFYSHCGNSRPPGGRRVWSPAVLFLFPLREF